MEPPVLRLHTLQAGLCFARLLDTSGQSDHGGGTCNIQHAWLGMVYLNVYSHICHSYHLVTASDAAVSEAVCCLSGPVCQSFCVHCHALLPFWHLHQ